MTDPLVPLMQPPAQQAMAISQALRQAAIDVPKDLPPGIYLTARVAEAEGIGVAVTVKAKALTGEVVWRRAYDGRGQSVSAVVGVQW